MRQLELDLPELLTPYLGMTHDEYECCKAFIEQCEKLRLEKKVAMRVSDVVNKCQGLTCR